MAWVPSSQLALSDKPIINIDHSPHFTTTMPSKWRSSLTTTNTSHLTPNGLKRASQDHHHNLASGILNSLRSTNNALPKHVNLRYNGGGGRGGSSVYSRGGGRVKRPRFSSPSFHDQMASFNGAEDGFDWPTYLKSNNLLAIPPSYFLHVPFDVDPAVQTPSKGNKAASSWKANQYLEGIDPFREGSFCTLSIASLVGRRVQLHFCGYDTKYDFWTTIDSPYLFPVGWCRNNGRRLLPPKPKVTSSADDNQSEQEFDWTTYIGSEGMGSTCVPVDAFRTPWDCPFDPQAQPDHLFSIGLKLEATDKRNPALTCVATVRDFIGDFILISFDGWDPGYDQWLHASSELLHPMGYCQANDRLLSVPRDWTNRFNEFTWNRYLKETNSKAVPEDAFKKEYPTSRLSSKLKVGQCFELVDRRCPQLVRVASIASIQSNGLLEVKFVGWDDKYNQIVETGSLDLFPVGYCKAIGHPLQSPPGFNTNKSQHRLPNGDGPSLSLDGYDIDNHCSTYGCKGIGHVKGPRHISHSRSSGCPYVDANIKRDFIRGHERLGGLTMVPHSSSSQMASPEPSLSAPMHNSVLRATSTDEILNRDNITTTTGGDMNASAINTSSTLLPLDLTTSPAVGETSSPALSATVPPPPPSSIHSTESASSTLQDVADSTFNVIHSILPAATSSSLPSSLPTMISHTESETFSSPPMSLPYHHHQPRRRGRGRIAGFAASSSRHHIIMPGLANQRASFPVGTVTGSVVRKRGRPRKFDSLRSLPSQQHHAAIDDDGRTSSSVSSHSSTNGYHHQFYPPPSMVNDIQPANSTIAPLTTSIDGLLSMEPVSVTTSPVVTTSSVDISVPTTINASLQYQSTSSDVTCPPPLSSEVCSRTHVVPIASVIPNKTLTTTVNGHYRPTSNPRFQPPPPRHQHHNVTEDTSSNALTSKLLPQVHVALLATRSAGLDGPHLWTCDMVGQFIGQLLNNPRLGDSFVDNDIDGSALLYLEQSDLMQTLNLKLGPAVKVSGAIQVLRRSVLSASSAPTFSPVSSMHSSNSSQVLSAATFVNSNSDFQFNFGSSTTTGSDSTTPTTKFDASEPSTATD